MGFLTGNGWNECYRNDNFSFGYITPESAYDVEYGLARTRYVLENRWLPLEPGTVERDRYDSHLDTTLVGMCGHDGTLVAGMRLTKVRSVENSLTYSMMDGTVLGCSDITKNDGLQAMMVRAGSVISDGGSLYDITRFTPVLAYFSQGTKREQVRRYRYFRSNVHLMFGVGCGLTSVNENLPGLSRWMFLGDKTVPSILTADELQHDTVSVPSISEADVSPLFFGMISPVSAALGSRRVREALVDSIEKASEREGRGWVDPSASVKRRGRDESERRCSGQPR